MSKRSRPAAKPQDDGEWARAQKTLKSAAACHTALTLSVPGPAAVPATPAAELVRAFRRTELPPASPGSAAKVAAAVMALRRAEELYQESRDQLMIATARQDAVAVSRASAECRSREEGVRAARTALERTREAIRDARSHAAIFGSAQVTKRVAREFAKLFDEPQPRGSRPSIESRSMTRKEYELERHRNREEIRQQRIANRERLGGSNGSH